MDVKPTAEVIKHMAVRMRDYARGLDRIAKRMVEKDDLELASEAMQEVKNCFANLRTDLLVSRPLREYERHIRDLDRTLEAMEDRDFDRNG